MEMRQIRYALSVAKERSFTGASAQLNVSQSAISEQVKLLEQAAGFEIFHRTSRGVDLTEPGRQFLYEAERVMSDVMGLSEVARRLRGVGVDIVTVGIISGLAPIFVPRLLSDDLIPADVRLHLRTAPTRVLFDELHEDRLDLGIAVDVAHDRVPAGFSVSRMAEMNMVLIVSPDHHLAKRQSLIDVSPLVTEPMIMSELAVGYGQIVGSMFEEAGIRPRIRAVVDNIETMKVVVQTGTGVALVPEGCADKEERLGLLSVVPITRTKRIAISAYRSRRAVARRKDAILKRIVGEWQ